MCIVMFWGFHGFVVSGIWVKCRFVVAATTLAELSRYSRGFFLRVVWINRREGGVSASCSLRCECATFDGCFALRSGFLASLCVESYAAEHLHIWLALWAADFGADGRCIGDQHIGLGHGQLLAPLRLGFVDEVLQLCA